MEKGIMFQTWGVQAILAGIKTVTRRIKFKCSVGNLLWVWETYCPIVRSINDGKKYTDNGYIYKASYNGIAYNGFWKSSLFMPKKAARIWLECTSFQEEKLHDITINEIKKEGVINWIKFNNINPCISSASCYIDYWIKIWDSINKNKKDYAWKDNPTVNRIEFKIYKIYEEVHTWQ